MGPVEGRVLLRVRKKELIVVYYLQVTTLTKLRNSTNLIRKGGGVTVYVVVYMYLIEHNVQYENDFCVIKNKNSQVSLKEKQFVDMDSLAFEIFLLDNMMIIYISKPF